MSATAIQRSKIEYDKGVVEIAIWRVPVPVAPSVHSFKYRLVYVVDSVRVVGYDNERGKGDHRHLGAVELPYQFVNLTTLLVDFWQDVEKKAGE
jgi:hypothetical protein